MNKKCLIEFLIRSSGFIFWYNLLNIMFNNSQNLNKMQHLIIMFICFIVGVVSVRIKKRLIIEN